MALPANGSQRGLSGYRVDKFKAVGTVTTMNSKQVIKQLESDGWYLARVKGSPHQFKHPDGDIPMGTLRSIERQAGWRK